MVPRKESRKLVAGLFALFTAEFFPCPDTASFSDFLPEKNRMSGKF